MVHSTMAGFGLDLVVIERKYIRCLNYSEQPTSINHPGITPVELYDASREARRTRGI
jgi:hypothetical protein